jgi:hypothetical protein
MKRETAPTSANREKKSTTSELLERAQQTLDTVRTQLQRLLEEEGLSKGAEKALRAEVSVLDPIGIPSPDTLSDYRKRVTRLTERADGTRAFGRHVPDGFCDTLRVASASRLIQLMDGLQASPEDVPRAAQWRTWEAALHATVMHQAYPQVQEGSAQEVLRDYIAEIPFIEIDTLHGTQRGQHMTRTTSEKGVAFLHIANLAALRSNNDESAVQALTKEGMLFRLKTMILNGHQPRPLTAELGHQIGKTLSRHQQEDICERLFQQAIRSRRPYAKSDFADRLGLGEQYQRYVGTLREDALRPSTTSDSKTS